MLAALYTPGAHPVHKATIVPRGHALGYVAQVCPLPTWACANAIRFHS